MGEHSYKHDRRRNTLNMAGRYSPVCLALIFIFLNVQEAISSGSVEILFHKFRLTNPEDRCCSCVFLQEKCDIIFEICLTHGPGPHCMFDSIHKGVYEDRPDIDFKDDRLSLPLPKKSFSIKVKISDDDFFINQYIDTVQVFLDNLKPTQNGRRGNYSLYTMTGDKSILELKVRSHCDEGYYGHRCRDRCEANDEGGHTCNSNGGYPSCDDDEYFITLHGVVDERNLQDLRTGLVDILKELGGVEGDVNIQVSTNVEEIDPGVMGTIVTFCLSQADGPVQLEIIKDIFETEDDDHVNSYLPFDLFRRQEMSNRTLDNQGTENKRTWMAEHWYVILVIFIVIFIVVIVCVVVFFIIKARKRLQSEEQFWRCHSGQDKRSVFDIGFINPFYGKTRRPSDVIEEARRDRPISCISDVPCQSVSSENHYEDLENLSSNKRLGIVTVTNAH